MQEAICRPVCIKNGVWFRFHIAIFCSHLQILGIVFLLSLRKYIITPIVVITNHFFVCAYEPVLMMWLSLRVVFTAVKFQSRLLGYNTIQSRKWLTVLRRNSLSPSPDHKYRQQVTPKRWEPHTRPHVSQINQKTSISVSPYSFSSTCLSLSHKETLLLQLYVYAQLLYGSFIVCSADAFALCKLIF